ncbi:hypothetical protein [Lignipirellula cremea]|uniref:Uncharacterized protein n=1 Tax=Lignipirellula cremea TaxID=2528010 RepID=A0A518DYL4_9BACT|nr:hypothetical protein [Lignipirellula cremea]QDU96943.1 hypothetical protein Pla8534_47680 [Lignipirellula cremea]
MESQFDPYYQWLGIPPHEQPADHYRLLGVARFEANLDVIENAADQRMAHVRNYQAGKYAVDSQRVLNHISTARVSLLDPQKKSAYDAQLHQQQLAAAPVAMPVSAGGASPAMVAPPVAGKQPRAGISVNPARAVGKRRKKFKVEVLISLVALVLLVIGLVGAGFWYLSQPPAAESFHDVAPATGANASTSAIAASPGEQAGQEVASSGTAADPASVVESSSPPVADEPAVEPALSNPTDPVAVVKPPLVDPFAPAIDTRPPADGAPVTPGGEGVPLTGAGDPPAGISAGEDLLKDLDLTKAILMGAAGRLGPNLIVGGDAGDNLVLLPTPDPVPGSFRLSIVARRRSKTGSLRIGLMVQGKASVILELDALVDTTDHSGLSLVNGRDLRDPEYGEPTHKGRLLEEGQTHLLCCILSGPTLELEVDKTSVYRWAGDVRTLRLPSHINHAEGLFLDAQDGEFEIASVRLEPEVFELPGGGDGGFATTKENGAGVLSGRWERPADSDLATAVSKVRKVFQDDYRFNAPAAKGLLAVKLFKTGRDEFDPLTRYALLSEASEAAIAGGDLTLAWQAAEAIGSSYNMEPFAQQAVLLEKYLAGRTTADQRMLAVQLAMPLLDQMETAHRFDDAAGLLDQLNKAVARLSDPPLKVALRDRTESLEKLKVQGAYADAARERLQASPGDPQANQNLGMYLCFVEHDWASGLPHLAAGGDAAIAAAARQDLDSPEDPQQLIKIGQEWVDLAKGRQDPAKSAMLRRGKVRLESALLGVPALDRQDLQQKIAQINEQLGDAVAPDAAFGPASGYQGLIGRVALNQADTGVLLQYVPGKAIAHDEVESLLLQPANGGRLLVHLKGNLQLARQQQVSVIHRGGSTAGGLLTLKIDGKVVGTVGDDRSKNDTYNLSLPAGSHSVEWMLAGGLIGDNCELQFVDAETGALLPLLHDSQLFKEASTASSRVSKRLGQL